MPYELIVVDKKNIESQVRGDSTKYTAHFGSAALVSQYWCGIARDNQLSQLKRLCEQASSDDGFKIAGNALQELLIELDFLEKYWDGKKPPIEDKLHMTLQERNMRLREAIAIAIKNEGELIVF